MSEYERVYTAAAHGIAEFRREAEAAIQRAYDDGRRDGAERMRAACVEACADQCAITLRDESMAVALAALDVDAVLAEDGDAE